MSILATKRQCLRSRSSCWRFLSNSASSDGSFFQKCFDYFETGAYRGFADLHAASDALEEWCLAHFAAPFAIFTTHDLYIAAYLAARTVISRFTIENWPRFLDSAAIILAPDGSRRYALVRAGLSDRVTGV